MAQAKDSVRNLHVVAFAYPLQGHMNPMFAFAKKVAATGAAVTLVTTETCHADVLGANNGTNPFQAHSLPSLRTFQVSDGLPRHFDRSRNAEKFLDALATDMASHVDDLMAGIVVSQPPVTCIVADTAFVWADSIAKKYCIPHISFWTETAAAFSIYRHWHLLDQRGQISSFNDTLIDGVPGLPAVRNTEVPSYLKDCREGSVIKRVISGALSSAEGADLIISTAIEELEKSVVSAIVESQKKFLCLGPLLLAAEKAAISMWEESDCTRWLSSKSIGSVLYISFGSHAQVDMRLIEEMAMGLLQSRQTFLWVLRPNLVRNGVSVKDVFGDKLDEGNGKVVGWCRQRVVLGHPAVGGFLTHCGWNSIVESLWEGVPMLAFPLASDQFINRRLIVEEWCVAESLGGADSSLDLVSREEFAASVKHFMVGGGRRLNVRIESVRNCLRSAVADARGSASRNFGVFIDALTQK